MKNNFTTRIEELKLLGWSEEGAREYSKELLDQNFLEEFLLQNQSLIILILILICVSFIIILINYYKKINKEKLVFNLENQKKISFEEQSIEIEVVKPKSIKKTKREAFIKVFIKELKSTRIDTGIIFEHFILIIVISFELSIKLLRVIFPKHQLYNKKSIESRNQSSPQRKVLNKNELHEIKIDARKKILMRKTNLELKSILKGIPYISKMNKEALIEQIIILETQQSKAG